MQNFKYVTKAFIGTYDHRLRRNGHPVRSAIHKPQIGRLVVGWVTTSEYLLLYVFFPSFFSRPLSEMPLLLPLLNNPSPIRPCFLFLHMFQLKL